MCFTRIDPNEGTESVKEPSGAYNRAAASLESTRTRVLKGVNADTLSLRAGELHSNRPERGY
jgi:hypothetical protein